MWKKQGENDTAGNLNMSTYLICNDFVRQMFYELNMLYGHKIYLVCLIINMHRLCAFKTMLVIVMQFLLFKLVFGERNGWPMQNWSI